MIGRRILVVTNMWPGEGYGYAGIFVERQVAALRRAAPDWTFDVFTMAGPRGRKDYLLALPRLRRALRRGYDVVHAHYGFTGATAALAAADPLVITLHGGDVNLAWQRPFTRLGVARAHRTIAVSERLRDAWGDPTLPVLSCGVPTELFRPLPRREARDRLGLPQDARIVLFPADPKVPVKDHGLFRAAMDSLPEDLRRDLLERVLADVPPREVPWHMAAADIVVLTSKHESGPLVVKEALACGIRVVSVDVGDARSTLAGVPGCAITTHDPAGVAHATALALRAPVHPGEADARRRRVFELGLDDPSIARRLIALYRDVIAANAGATE